MNAANHAPKLEWTDLDRRAVDTARILAADAVQKVGNGHPGTAMSLAPAAYMLFQNVMRHDPADSHWTGRDRFVLSCGHSSLTLYIQLYLSGYDVSLDDLKSLRTWGSNTPGHPEYKHTDGVEITTGPLGQGLASAVGMAMSARRERGLYDPDTPAGESPFDHHIWVIASDGDLQEGVTSEASSLAGMQELGNLIVLYDDNKISIEDDTEVAFTEDVSARYAAYGWHIQDVDWTAGGEYHENVDALYDALLAAKAETNRPSLINLRTIIGWPAPNKQNTGAAHGSALGDDEVRAVKEILGFDPDKTFEVSDEVISHAHKLVQRGEQAKAEWTKQFDAWKEANPENAKLFERIAQRELPDGWTDVLPQFPADNALATRAASGQVLNALAPVLPELWGGSADLAGSNNTTMKGEPSFIPEERSTKEFSGNKYGRTLHFGIREHAMGAIINGIVLHGGTRAYGGTFLVFSDYMRPAVRLSALMQIPSIFVWTHDSIGLGEDGPTHQPIEHLAALRAIPGLDVVRPADANEVAWAWRTLLEQVDRPTGLVLTRQNVPTLERGDGAASGDTLAAASGVAKGAYVLAEARNGEPELLLLATGSEVQIALAAREQLEDQGIATRVVSMPSKEWFAHQGREYREEVLPTSVRARVSIEAGTSQGWREFVGDAGRCISLEHYGASADFETLFREFGFTPENVVAAAKESLEDAKGTAIPGGPLIKQYGGTGDR